MIQFNANFFFAVAAACLYASYLAVLFHWRYEGTLGSAIYVLMVVVFLPPSALMVFLPLYSLLSLPFANGYKALGLLGLAGSYWLSLRLMRHKLLQQRIRLKEGREWPRVIIQSSDNEELELPNSPNN